MEHSYSKFNNARKTNRDMDTLIGLCMGIVSDEIINQDEAEFLKGWLLHNYNSSNPVMINLLNQLSAILEDGILDKEEANELLITLKKINGDREDIAELQKPTSIAFDDPEPDVIFAEKNFTLTGTFSYGTRKECIELISSLQGIVPKSNGLTNKTDYLVIGSYVSDDWIHQTYGRKIEKALTLKENKKSNIKIISEKHWLEQTKTITPSGHV